MDTRADRLAAASDASADAPRIPSSTELRCAVEAEAAGLATASQQAMLAADVLRWRTMLHTLVRETEEALRSARQLDGELRHQVVRDLEDEQETLARAWTRLTGDQVTLDRPADPTSVADDEDDDEDDEPGAIALQLSWEPGKVVAWAGGHRAPTATADELTTLLAELGAPANGWTRHRAVALPGGGSAEALAIGIADVLGWLVAGATTADPPDDDAPGAGPDAVEAGNLRDDGGDDGTDDPGRVEGPRLGHSARWLGHLALWAVELVAGGAMVPLLRQRKRGGSEGRSAFSVRWTPALVDAERHRYFVETMPASVGVVDASLDARGVVNSALTAVVDAIGRDAARRIEVPAPPPVVRNAADAAESYLAHLDGASFEAPGAVGNELVARLERWSRSVVGSSVRLIVQLDPPDSGDAWHLNVLCPLPDAPPTSVEEAMAYPGTKPKEIEDQINRLERMVPELKRPGGRRRGQVVLSQDEAWQLMSETGRRLAAAGFDVRVPGFSRRRPTPSLRVFAEGASGSVAGANQLADVRWSAVFGDVELSAAEISRLAREARPLVRTAGRWVELDKADLKAAADALAERASVTQMTGGEMLRLALGLEGSTLAGGVSVRGNAWAAQLLAKATDVSQRPVGAPEGFRGELRAYQAEALAWLGFLDDAGLGGCLALDMGLGKTPTMLAHLQAGVGRGPSLVVAPPAVVGNWAAEARRFVPGLRVIVHHGASRATEAELAAEADRADVVITTYGTAVRDIDAIESITWNRLVLDEAQAIKNVANDTSQQLRRIGAHTRVALTGTPIENGLGDLWAILDFANPGLVGTRPQFVATLSQPGDGARADGESAMRALNGILVFRRTKSEPAIAAELPDRIDELDRCAMTPEQVGLYQAVLDKLVTGASVESGEEQRKGQVLAAITALKQICNHPEAYTGEGGPLPGRSGKLARLEEIVDAVFAAGEKVLVFTHFAEWGQKLAAHLTERTGTRVECYHGGLSRTVRDQVIADFQAAEGAGALVLSLKAGGTGLNLTAASHVVLYDRWWNPAVEDQARDRAWRIGQTKTVIAHRLICPGTVDERVEEVVQGKRRIADMVLPKSSSLADLDAEQLRRALGLRPDELLTEELDAASEAEVGTDPHDAEAAGTVDDGAGSAADGADEQLAMVEVTA